LAKSVCIVFLDKPNQEAISCTTMLPCAFVMKYFYCIWSIILSSMIISGFHTSLLDVSGPNQNPTPLVLLNKHKKSDKNKTPYLVAKMWCHATCSVLCGFFRISSYLIVSTYDSHLYLNFTAYLTKNITTCYPRLPRLLSALTGVWLIHPGPSVFDFTESFSWRQAAQRSQSFDVKPAVVHTNCRSMYVLQGGKLSAWPLTIDNKIISIFWHAN
jgi:hypothetical protein